MVMASNGKKYDEILKIYYRGTSIVGIDEAKSEQDDKKPSN